MTKQLHMIPISQLQASINQPRTIFDESSIKELAISIQENGLIQPIVVRPYQGSYQIVAGERRYRACQLLQLEMIPCIVENYSDIEKAKVAMIENIQRENLTPIEEARAYDILLKEYHLTQSELAKQVGKQQSTIANKLRLLNLDSTIQEALKDRTITERHARALLSIEPEEQKKLLQQIMKKELNVKQTEELVKKSKVTKVKAHKASIKGMTKQLKIAVNTLHQAMDMIQRAGIQTEVIENEYDDEYVIMIKMKK